MQMGEMAHGRLACSRSACTGCLPLSESINISSLHQLAGRKRSADTENSPETRAEMVPLISPRWPQAPGHGEAPRYRGGHGCPGGGKSGGSTLKGKYVIRIPTGFGPCCSRTRVFAKEQAAGALLRAVQRDLDGITRAAVRCYTAFTASKSISSCSRSLFLQCVLVCQRGAGGAACCCCWYTFESWLPSSP